MKDNLYDKIGGQIKKIHFSVDNIEAYFYLGNAYSEIPSRMERQMYIHEHAWFELHIVKKGNIKIKTEDVTYIIGENEAMLIPPNKYHIICEASEDVWYASIGFEIMENKKISVENLYAAMKPIYSADTYTKLLQCPLMVVLVEKLFDYVESNKNTNSCRVQNMLTSFLFLLHDNMPTDIDEKGKNSLPERELPPQHLAEDRNYILDCVTSTQIAPPSLDALSQQIFLTKKQINRIVKKRYNMTYKQKQIRFRIENAKKYLIETDKAIDEIAILVGYTNITNFYQTFRRIVGVTPGEFRKGQKH